MTFKENIMATVEKPTAQSDLEELFELFSAGKSVEDTQLVRRVRERSDAARRAVFERNGLLDVAVPMIRALRDGEE